MPLYTFTLEKFHIGHKRSNIPFGSGDTDTVAFSLQVGDRKFDTLTKNMGNVDVGDHLVALGNISASRSTTRRHRSPSPGR